MLCQRCINTQTWRAVSKRAMTANPATTGAALRFSHSFSASSSAAFPRPRSAWISHRGSLFQSLLRYSLAGGACPSQYRTAVTLAKKPDEPEEPEVFKDGEPTIVLTEEAQQKLKQVSQAENNPNLALRIAVEPGGCHGYQYKMELTDETEEDDFHFKAAEGVSLFIDSVSLNLVKGSTIDYVTELIGSQFAIKDNPQAKGAGCGCGVSWEPIV